MNRFQARVTKIQTKENLNIVNFEFASHKLTMMSLDLDESLKVSSLVKLSVKPTHIALAKEFSGVVSYSNQLDAKIVEVENGELLSSIKLSVGDANFESIITKNSSSRMSLKIGDAVKIFIKASELSISEILKC
ncbi:MAG: TOBE domain-containing protein [Sulfurimonas sp.]|uniref:TOBE domain-containing protein n=1 Tax=Sulfurimonas sp. TaxID=2022749 RepID=UPI0025D08766|nr:TOBE domain-containing protein [Sulfurimonas sp.]MCK9490569.1 TOBE domain-containing protein [Sulfurimonas sp.]